MEDYSNIHFNGQLNMNHSTEKADPEKASEFYVVMDAVSSTESNKIFLLLIFFFLHLYINFLCHIIFISFFSKLKCNKAKTVCREDH